MLRWRSGELRWYLLFADEQHLFGPDRTEHDPMFTHDPEEAATMGHDRAITLVPRLMERMGFAETGDAYFEPVRLEDAIEEFGPKPAKERKSKKAASRKRG